MDTLQNEQDPFLNSPEADTTEWDFRVPSWVSNSEPPRPNEFSELIGEFDLDKELKTLDELRGLVCSGEEDREFQMGVCRARILIYAKNFATAEEKGTIVSNLLKALDAPHGFHDPEDLIDVREVVSYGVDWPTLDDLNEFIAKHKSTAPNLPLAIARLQLATDPKVIRDIVYKDFAPGFDWGPAK